MNAYYFRTALLRGVSFLVLLILFVLFSAYFSFAQNPTKVIKVGAYQNSPKIFRTENGKVSGFWPELLSNIAEKEGWEIKYVPGTWNENLKRLQKGEIDVMPDVAFTKSRAELFEFAKIPVMASWSRVYVRISDNSVRSLEDLKGKRIGGLIGSVNVEGPDGIKALVRSFNLNSRVIEMQSYNDVFQALEDGFVDAVITNRNFGDKYTQSHPVKKSPIMLSPVTLTFAFPKNSIKADKILRAIDYRMSEMMNDSDSVYFRLLSNYFETEIAEKTVKQTPLWVKYLLFFLSGMVVVMAVSMYMCGRKVVVKTKELQQINDELTERIAKEAKRISLQDKLIMVQQKHADMGQLMKSIAHQWRQPLNNIYLISQTIEEEWEKNAAYSDEIRNKFYQQEELIKIMSETIEDFREFFKPEYEPKTFNVTDALFKSLRLVSSELIKENIVYDFTCQYKGESCEFKNDYMADSSRCPMISLNGYDREFRQIVLNVLSNSIKALSNLEGYRRIDITLTADDSDVTVVISDNGGGVDEKIIERIFDPYFTTRDEGQGVGVGLYMCKTLLTKHMNGDIKVRNTKGGLETTITVSRGLTV